MKWRWHFISFSLKRFHESDQWDKKGKKTRTRTKSLLSDGSRMLLLVLPASSGEIWKGTKVHWDKVWMIVKRLEGSAMILICWDRQRSKAAGFGEQTGGVSLNAAIFYQGTDRNERNLATCVCVRETKSHSETAFLEPFPCSQQRMVESVCRSSLALPAAVLPVSGKKNPWAAAAGPRYWNPVWTRIKHWLLSLWFQQQHPHKWPSEQKDTRICWFDVFHGQGGPSRHSGPPPAPKSRWDYSSI